MLVRRFDRIFGLFAILAVVASPAAAVAQQSGGWVGTRVITKFGTVLKVGGRVVDDEKRQGSAHGGERRDHRVYRVKQVNGPWLWLVTEKGGISGWVKVGQVVPFDQATDYYTSELRGNPTSAVYASRGNIWQVKGELDIAIADYNEAIRLKPNSEVAYVARGHAWYAKKKYDKAIADYGEAIRLDPKYAAAYNKRGTAWSAKREYDKSIADYSEAIRLDPKFALTYYNRGLAWYDKKEYDKSITDYGEAIRLDPKDASAYCGRGAALHAKKEYDKAIADYGEAIRLDPKLAPSYSNRAWIWSSKKEYDKAIIDYGEAIRLDPKDAYAYNSRAWIWSSKKEYDKAIADYDEAIRLDPKDAYAYNSRAWIWSTTPDAKFRDGRKAVESATRACELTEWKSANDLDTLGAAYAEAGDFDAAIKWQEKAQGLYEDEKDKVKGRALLELYRAKIPYRDNS